MDDIGTAVEVTRSGSDVFLNKTPGYGQSDANRFIHLDKVSAICPFRGNGHVVPTAIDGLKEEARGVLHQSEGQPDRGAKSIAPMNEVCLAAVGVRRDFQRPVGHPWRLGRMVERVDMSIGVGPGRQVAPQSGQPYRIRRPRGGDKGTIAAEVAASAD